MPKARWLYYRLWGLFKIMVAGQVHYPLAQHMMALPKT